MDTASNTPLPLNFVAYIIMLPSVLSGCIDVIEEALKVDNWRKFLQTEQKLPDSFKG